MKEIKKFSKESFLNIANSVGNATKNTVTNISVTTKNVATSVAENVKEGSEHLGKQIDQMIYDNDKKRLSPIYESEITSEGFSLPTLVRVVSYDKRMENKACEGAVGFVTGKDTKILNIYKEFVDLLGISFYPYLEDAVYHVDPCYEKLYIKLDEYFAYLKKVRVDELTAVAQDLGAKHMEIVLKSSTSSSSNQDMSGSLNVANRGMSASTSKMQSSFSGVEVAAKVDFCGNSTPVEPKLVYFKNEGDIVALIKMRLNPNNENKILSKTYSLTYGNSSGIKISDAEKIDASLAHIKCGMSRSVTSEARNESNTILEYSITF